MQAYTTACSTTPVLAAQSALGDSLSPASVLPGRSEAAGGPQAAMMIHSSPAGPSAQNQSSGGSGYSSLIDSSPSVVGPPQLAILHGVSPLPFPDRALASAGAGIDQQASTRPSVSLSMEGGLDVSEFERLNRTTVGANTSSGTKKKNELNEKNIAVTIPANSDPTVFINTLNELNLTADTNYTNVDEIGKKHDEALGIQHALEPSVYVYILICIHTHTL